MSLPSTVPVAIVSIGAMFPGAPTTEAFWRDIVEGADRLTEVPRTHWLARDYYDPKPGTPDKVYTTRGGFLPEIPFSPMELGLPPSQLPAIDTAQLLSLVVAKRVLAEAMGGAPQKIDRSRVSVLLGVASATELVATMSGRLQIPVVEAAMRAAGVEPEQASRVRAALEACYVPWQEGTFPGLLGNVVSGRIANRFDLGGTNTVLDAACAGSLAAVDMAVQELSLNLADLVITGGVDTLNDILMFMCFAQTGALSRSGQCRPFSRDADGTMLGEGIGLFGLRRLTDAERDGDPIYAVIRSVGSSSDGRATSIYAPHAAGQARALERAYALAGLSPASIGLVEAHGTGTVAGDATEIDALRRIYDAAGARPRQTAIGSIKGQIGHTKAAAGAAGLAKAALALHHKVFPKTLHVGQPIAALEDPACPFYPSTEVRPWIQGARSPRRAAVSALGFGGTNFHVVLEEHVGKRPSRLSARPSELVLLGASDVRTLAQQCRSEAALARERGSLAHAAWRTQQAFDPAHPARIGVVAASVHELADQLDRAADTLERSGPTGPTGPLPRGLFFGQGPSIGPIAALFPGQGSQSVGMGGDLAIHFNAIRALWDEAADLDVFGEEALQDRVFPAPAPDERARQSQADRLTETAWAQPALACASLATFCLVSAMGLSPIATGGHSLGEVTALAAGGAFDDLTAIRVARLRGVRMAEVSRSTRGAMAAVAAPRDRVESLLRAWQSRAAVANHNAPNQTVITGDTEAVAAAEQAFSKEGIPTERLAVATAFHSPIVGGACGPFREDLERISAKMPKIQVFSNATADPYGAEGGGAEALRDRLADAIARPVRFVEQVEAMYAAGCRVFVDVGPGQVLSRLVKRCLEGRPHQTVSLDAPGKHGVTALFEGLAQLAVSGVPLRWSPLWEDLNPPADPAAEAPAKLTVMLTGANYGKPYPADEEKALSVARVQATGAGSPGTPAPAARTEIPESTPAASLPPPPPTCLPSQDEPPETDAMNPENPSLLVPEPSADISATPDLPESIAWLHAVRELQAPLIAAQMEYERAMAESHSAFLRTIESSYAAFTGAPSSPGRPEARPPAPAQRSLGDAEPRQSAPKARPPSAAPHIEPRPSVQVMSAPARLPVLSKRAPASAPVQTSHVAPASAPVQTSHIAPAAPAAARAPAPATPAAPARARPADLLALMLAIVSEKTGYPVEMIETTMDLESDLGIDSIKRVEILAATRERAPGLPSVEPARLAKLRTLGEIVEFLASSSSDAAEEAKPPGAAIVASPAADLARFVVLPEEAIPPGLATPGLFEPGLFVLVPDDGGVAQALAARMAAAGLNTVVSAEVPADARGVLFLEGLSRVRAPEDAFAVSRRAFEIARAFAARGAAGGALFVVIQDTGGDLGMSGAPGARPWLGGLAALAKTASLEWPASAVRAIDISLENRPIDEIVEALWRELTTGGSAVEAALSARGARTTLVARPAPRRALRAPSVGRGDVVIVSGGARGVTAACVIALAEALQPRLVLLGRTALSEEPEHARGVTDEAALKRACLDARRGRGLSATPREIGKEVERIRSTREVRATLAALDRLGISCRYEAVDLSRDTALDLLLEEVRAAWGPVRGIVHGAGILRDGLLVDRPSADGFDAVFDTKVRGLLALLRATEADPLSMICLFSSAAARAGNIGQSDYAMANEALNKVAHAEARRRGDGTRVVSIGWGPWEGGMVTPALRKHFTERGVGLIPIAAGSHAFVRELSPPQDRASSESPEILLGGDALAPPREISGDVRLDVTTWPCLSDHVIRGSVVVPLALSAAWLSGLAPLAPSSSTGLRLRDIRVKRGIVLPRFGEHPTTLRAVATPSNDGVALSLRSGAEDRAHVTAIARAGDAAPGPVPPDARGAAPAAIPPPWYAPNRLFHGPMFQAISEVTHLAADRVEASLFASTRLGWNTSLRIVDPALLDGVLQLALLANFAAGMPLTLPLGIGMLDVSGPPPEGARALVALKSRTSERALFDAWVWDATGKLVSTLEDIALFVVPTGAE